MNNWTEECTASGSMFHRSGLVSRQLRITQGLKDASEMVINWMEQIGFEIETYVDENAPYRPVIVAKSHLFMGISGLDFAHYDVEPADDNEWSSDPWNAKLSDGLLYGRGIADNIEFHSKIDLYRRTNP